MQQMMKHTQMIFAEYCGRAFSTIASSPMSRSVRDSWKEQSGLGLFGAFFGGWFGMSLKNLYHLREHWHKVDRMSEESMKRSKELVSGSAQLNWAISNKK